MVVVSDFVYVGASKYDFANDEGQVVRGAKVSLIPLEPSKSDFKVGYEVLIVSAPFDLFDSFSSLAPLEPYSFEMDVLFLSNGSLKMRIVRVIPKDK